MVAEIWYIDIHSQRKFTEGYTGQRNAAFVEHDAKSLQNLQQAIEKKKAGWTSWTNLQRPGHHLIFTKNIRETQCFFLLAIHLSKCHNSFLQ